MWRACGRPLLGLPSHPTRGAWIEIGNYNFTAYGDAVAPHTGCVD